MRAAGQRVGPDLFFSANDGEVHGVAGDVSRVAGRGRRGFLIATYRAAVFRTEGARGVEMTARIDCDGLRDLAVRAIEFHVGALLGDFQDDVRSAPRARGNGATPRRGTSTGHEQNTGEGQHPKNNRAESGTIHRISLNRRTFQFGSPSSSETKYLETFHQVPRPWPIANLSRQPRRAVGLAVDC